MYRILSVNFALNNSILSQFYWRLVISKLVKWVGKQDWSIIENSQSQFLLLSGPGFITHFTNTQMYLFHL